jgi:CheY-like chemotaxis protein
MVFCDVDMPVMNGIEVLRTVKADPNLEHIPFIIMTGRDDMPTRRTISNLSVSKYLTKPVMIKDFLATIVFSLQEK